MRLRALLTLTFAGCSLTLRGEQGSASVFDSSSGRPIAGAALLLSREDGTDVEAETDSDGLPPGHYSVAAVPTRYASAFSPVFFPGSANPGRAVFFDLKPGETRTSVNLTVTVPDARSISGKLSGMPADMSGAAVALLTRGGLLVPTSGAMTDADGAFVLRDVPPGEYQLIAWIPFLNVAHTQRLSEEQKPPVRRCTRCQTSRW